MNNVVDTCEKANWKDVAIALDQDGMSWRKIAKTLGVAKSSCSDFLRKMKQDRTIPVQTLKQSPTVPPKFCSVVSDAFNDGMTHLVIPDTQCKPGISLEYLKWIGHYIVDKKPSVIIHLGDHADMESLSGYDKGKKAAEGKRIGKDIEAAIEGMSALLSPLRKLQESQKERLGFVEYVPRMVMTLGNHEQRIQRHVEANPELEGFLSYADLRYEEMGWEVYDYLEPVVVGGITYIHYFPNPFTGKPYGGSAQGMLQKIGGSFTQGHKQTLDVATRTLHTGQQQWGIVAGACYDHSEGYKGYCGNKHWRGIIVKHNVKNGSYDPLFVSLEYLKGRYGKG